MSEDSTVPTGAGQYRGRGLRLVGGGPGPAPAIGPLAGGEPNLGDYVEKTVAAHHRCVKDHYAVLEQAAAEQAPDPQQAAGQATAVHAENRAAGGPGPAAL